jgi:hypothetical protein
MGGIVGLGLTGDVILRLRSGDAGRKNAVAVARSS